MISPDVVAFVDQLLEDWAQDEWQICGEFCVGADEHQATADEITARRAEWEALQDD